jgi:hypothetical protein
MTDTDRVGNYMHGKQIQNEEKWEIIEIKKEIKRQEYDVTETKK